jgi:RNA polymerase sigma-70 factor (ECF subfamily)
MRASGYFVDVQKRQPALRVVGQNPEPAAVVTDDDIIQAFARKDRRAAELVYDRLLGVVDATLYRVIGRREVDHDDLIQATFEQIILTLSRKSYAGGCSLKGWGASIACHVGLNAIRSRRRARRVLAPEVDSESVAATRAEPQDFEARMIARQEVDDLRAELAEMDPGRATTIVLHDAFGMSLAETARLTGVSMAAAQSRLVRGRREIRARMKSREERP